MPNGRAVLLFRRLSAGDTKLLSLNINHNCKDTQLGSPVNLRELSFPKRLSTNCLTCDLSVHPPLSRSLSDNIIKMASTSNDISGNDKPKFTNSLINEKSPYLLQHAHNPVDWYPWCQEAFDKAKTENKLIFLSVGYSTCHWCHVMEKESFENEEVAKIMNDHYINIKVDREERPDIDHTYMLFVQATTQRGGWPMSVFLTPDLKPLTGGTYFPPEDHWGRPGFKTILTNLAHKWNQNHADFVEAGDNVMAALQKIAHLDNETNIPIPGENIWKSCVNTFKHIYEPEFGGFGDAPKFPQASIFNFLFHFYSRDKTNELGKNCLDMALYTLKMIAKGGIHDHVSSGFARYSVDKYWHVPHFEKMLYDQAQLTSAFTDAYLATKDEFYAEVVHDIIKYVNRDLRHESGGFYSAEDADSYPTFASKQKKEGAFCVWEFDELKTLLDGKELNSVSYFDVFCDYFNVKVNGNISPESDPHKELTKKNVLIIFGTKEKTAEKFNLSIEQFDKIIKECIDILYLARQTRPRPHLDSKMICSWNGLMIAGLAQAGQALGNKDYVDDAIKAANFVKQHLYDESTETLLHSCYKGEDGSVANLEKPINAFLDDYAFFIRGLLNLYEASLDLQWLGWANRLQQKQNTLFWDEEHGGYFLSSADDTTVVLRLKEDSDGAEPSGNSVSCHNLLRLSAYGDKTSSPQGGDNERALAEKLLKAFAKRLTDRPASLPEMMSALMFHIDSPTQVLIAGGYSDPRTLELIRVVRARLLPGRVLAVADPNATHTNEIPVLNRIRPHGDTPAAYVCRRYACSLPVTDVRQLESLLDEPAHKPSGHND